MKIEMRDSLKRLKEMTDDELGSFEIEIVDALGELDDANESDSVGSYAQLHALHLADGSLKRELAKREQVALAASGAPAPAASQVARMAALQSPPARSPEAAPPTRRRAVLTASANLRDWDPGKPIGDRYELAAAMAETLRSMDRQGPPRGPVVLASARYEYPEDRRLTEDQDHNARILDAITSPNALTATGGICAPVNVEYSVPTWATAARPLRDGLPGFQANRGGLRYVQAPSLATWAAATGIWTEATDASPGASTKPIVSLACGSEQIVYVEAISTRIGFGNFQGRFAPEQVAANTDLAMAAAARIAENNILDLIAAQCVSGVTTATLLGATRDLITAINQAAAGYRNLYRLPDDGMLTAIFPSWVRDLIRVDLAREIAHDNSGPRDSLAVSNDQVATLLRAHGVNPIFHLDGQGSGVTGGVAQTFVAPATGAIKPFPTKMVWYLFAEGMVQYLDGGRLDLGVVRDSTLNATNDVELFIEVFETVAFRGFTGGAVQFVSTLCSNGGSAGTISTAAQCA